MLHQVIAIELGNARVEDLSGQRRFEIRTPMRIENARLEGIVSRYFTQGGMRIVNNGLPLGFRVYDGQRLVGMLTVTNQTHWKDVTLRRIMGSFIFH